MNIEYLKYFSELAKIQHYGKAAKALNIHSRDSVMRSSRWKKSTEFRCFKKKGEM